MNIKSQMRLYRCYPYWFAKGCIFVHVPKAAGTSINFALYGRALGHHRTVEIRGKFPSLYRKSFVFAFVRNPWDRVLSAYRFAVKGRTESMGVSNPAQYRVPEFESFERFLFEWLAHRDVLKLDKIFQPQCWFVCGASGENMLDFTGKVERIDKDLAFVQEQLGSRLELPHVNRTMASGGYAEAYRSAEMIDLVAGIYAKDIALFNYDF